MKFKRFTLLLSVALVVCASPFARAEGESLSESALNTIRTNCITAQVTIQRVQQAEKSTRINRGYLYDTLLKLMANLNSRVAQNKIDSPELLSITSEYERQLKVFIADYTKYDESLSNLTSLDCREQPAKFQETLIDARRLRSSLSQTVNALGTLLDRYQGNVNAVKELVESGV